MNRTIAVPISTSNLGDLAITQVSAGFEHNLLIAVPEPSSFVLAAIGLTGALLVSKRRRA